MLKKIINFLYFNNRFESKLKNAYKILERKKEIQKIYQLKEKLHKIRYVKNRGIDNIFVNYNLDFHLSLNQFIYSRIINKPIFTSILMFCIAFNKKFIFPLPQIYLIEIKKLVNVNFFLSKSIFYIFTIVFFLYQFFSIFKFVGYFFKKKKADEKKIYLDSIPKLYSEESFENKNLDFFKWVIKKFEISSNLIFVHSNPNIENKIIQLTNNSYRTVYCKEPISYFLNFSNFQYFILSFFQTLFTLAKIIFFHKIEMLLLSKELFSFYLFKNIKMKQNYDLCLFNNSNMVFRPLWTYVNETNNKSSVILYFYSLNLIPLLQELVKERYFDTYGYSLHTWTKYIVWTKEHGDWLEKNITNNKIEYSLTKYLPFAGKNIPLIKNKKILTIFDVPPKRPGIYYLLNNPYNIYTIDYCIKFVDDILNAVPTKLYSNIEIVFKMKKEYKNIDPVYKKFLQEKLKIRNIKIMSDISPESIIDISDATISIPFTSTAITSFRKNKKTIYYDPSGKLSNNNCLEKNIELITSSTNLQRWIIRNFTQ